MQRKPSWDENILEQHQFWRYLSPFFTLFSPSSQNNYVLSQNKDVRNLCPIFEFKPEPVPISSSNAELHGTGICARSYKGSISNDFWCPVFVPSGKETFRGWNLGSFPERRVVVEPRPYTSFLHAAGISKLESVVCGGRLEEVVNFELSCLLRNDVRCMLFVTYVFFLAVLEF